MPIDAKIRHEKYQQSTDKFSSNATSPTYRKIERITVDLDSSRTAQPQPVVCMTYFTVLHVTVVSLLALGTGIHSQRQGA